MEVLEAVRSSGDTYMLERVNAAVSLIRRCLEIYGPSGLSFSFNGGKDSTVLLHLTRAAVAQYREEHGPEVTGPGDFGGIYTFFYDHGSDFKELYEFVALETEKYGLATETLTTAYKEGLQKIVTERPVKAILLGTRRGDPNAGDQEHFSPSTPGWPPFMRVNPVLEWTYHEVWNFLLATKVPYCSLYDRGYTSIGSTATTVPNDLLRRSDGSFAHARLLADPRQERAGRVRRTNSVRPTGASALMRSAGILIVGDELLSGKVEDSNSSFMAKQLRQMGWKLGKIMVVPDDVVAIAKGVKALSDEFEVVLSAGGIGPTVDDITVAGIARAYGLNVTRLPELERRLKEYFGPEATAGHLKMAEAPDTWDVELLSCGTLETEDKTLPHPFPVLRVKNIYLLPGVPTLLREKWKFVAEYIGTLKPFHSVTMRLNITDETLVAEPLREIAADMGSNVEVGSYPVSDQSDGAGVILSLESKDSFVLQAAHDRLKSLLPSGCVISEEVDMQDSDKMLNK
eukprot:CAMPEP_0177759498 /NCGR_PEP_ID=MMETSP0491_2-20121128/4767_1 /TAXON_ID=63592 /ORGANISM="Tetraselmis chuii, Strain PLY429" /LENGTH=512 /DNA_ID=CAMNT_0019275337 /DNA_START=159 /DNA_END=1697 /DNA_ORIENTATION=-